MLKLRRSSRRIKCRRAAAVKRRRSKSVEFQLPDEIIQHIQSFMDGREAARAALLSKSWHRAWSTRPILCFNLEKGFRRFAKKTMKRYEDLNLRIRTFALIIQRYEYHSLAADLILRAIKLGATDLRIQTPSFGPPPFGLPEEMLQSKTLEYLRVHGCTIGCVTSCSNLKSLELSNMSLNPDIIGDLISGCPLIEELTLERLRWRTRLLFDVATLMKLRKLEHLRLVSLDFGDSLYRSDLWPNFACLKEVEILNFIPNREHKHKVVRICSASLERIHIMAYESADVDWEFDVPNLRRFRFKGTELPQIKLKTSRREANVDIEIECSIRFRQATRASWFGSLNELVKMLELCEARVSLSMFLHRSPGGGGGYVGDGLAIPALENLTLMGSDAVPPGLLEALFWSCRPNFVNIETCLLRGIREEDVEVFQQPRALPWKTLLDASRNSQGGFIRFQLK